MQTSKPVKDINNLSEYKEELARDFRIYKEDIFPFIVQFEVLENEFPIEVQNEIRAMYTHLTRAACADKQEDIADNIHKIHSHTKRALLDCFKYSCFAILDEYDDFFNKYQNIDFTFINQGKLIVDIQNKYQEAREKLRFAKMQEIETLTENEILENYQEAYNSFCDLKRLLQSALTDAEHLKHKAAKKDTRSNVCFAIGVVLAVIGIVVGLIGIF